MGWPPAVAGTWLRWTFLLSADHADTTRSGHRTISDVSQSTLAVFVQSIGDGKGCGKAYGEKGLGGEKLDGLFWLQMSIHFAPQRLHFLSTTLAYWSKYTLLFASPHPLADFKSQSAKCTITHPLHDLTWPLFHLFIPSDHHQLAAIHHLYTISVSPIARLHILDVDEQVRSDQASPHACHPVPVVLLVMSVNRRRPCRKLVVCGKDVSVQ